MASILRQREIINRRALAEELVRAVAESPATLALLVASAALHCGYFLLLQRARASRETLSHGELKRLCGVLERVGRRMAEQSTLVEHLVGLQLMATAAEWLEDTLKLQYVQAQRAVARRMMHGSQRVGTGRWPLRSLMDEVMETGVRNEMLHLSDFSTEPPEDGSPLP